MSSFFLLKRAEFCLFTPFCRTNPCISHLFRWNPPPPKKKKKLARFKVVMQGKLIAVACNSPIVSYDQNISLIFYVKDGSHVRLRHSSCVYITAQRQYTARHVRCVHFCNKFPCITSLARLIKLSHLSEKIWIGLAIQKRRRIVS